MISPKEVMTFRRTVTSGASNLTLRQRCKAAGTIDEIRVRFYAGQQGTLHVRPLLLKKPDIMQSLIAYSDDTLTYLAGDDDYFVMPVSVPCDNDDEVVVLVDNVGDYDYDVVVDVVVDYLGGRNRVV